MQRLLFPAFTVFSLSACELVAGIGEVTLARDGAAASDGTVPDADAKDADADAAPADGASGCPVPMVEIDVVNDGGTYCIDPFEVSRGDFNAFLQSPGSLPPFTSPAFCATSNVGSRPAQETNAALLSLPVTSVEWCYAFSYCAWRGKRLCGKIGGGESVDRTWQQIDLRNQWDYACANGAFGSEYGYGQPYDAGACNAEGDAAAPVGSRSSCRGASAPFDHVFDLSGNVAELDDMASAHAPDPLREIGARGGSWASGAADSRCGSYFGFGPYAVGFPEVGFRCCAEVKP